MSYADDRRAAAEAIRALRAEVRWKPGKAAAHLVKRKAQGHLPASATLDEYNGLVVGVLNGLDNSVYRYPFGGRDFYAVRGEAQGRDWLVIFGADGVMETAFPPDDMTDYLINRGFVPMGPVRMVVT